MKFRQLQVNRCAVKPRFFGNVLYNLQILWRMEVSSRHHGIPAECRFPSMFSAVGSCTSLWYFTTVAISLHYFYFTVSYLIYVFPAVLKMYIMKTWEMIVNGNHDIRSLTNIIINNRIL